MRAIVIYPSVSARLSPVGELFLQVFGENVFDEHLSWLTLLSLECVKSRFFAGMRSKDRRTVRSHFSGDELSECDATQTPITIDANTDRQDSSNSLLDRE